jgi:hypothetical protein
MVEQAVAVKKEIELRLHSGFHSLPDYVQRNYLGLVSPDVKERVRAVRDLTPHVPKHEMVAEAIRRVLEDEDPRVRGAAINVFERLGPKAKKFLPELVKRAATAYKNKDESAKAGLLAALKSIGVEESVLEAGKIIGGQDYEQLSEHALSLIEEMDSSRVVPTLVQSLESKGGNSYFALHNLEKSKDPRALSELMRLFSKGPRENLRFNEIAASLKRIKRPNVVSFFERQLKSRRAEVVKQAAFTLAEVGTKDSLGALKKAAERTATATEKEIVGFTDDIHSSVRYAYRHLLEKFSKKKSPAK